MRMQDLGHESNQLASLRFGDRLRTFTIVYGFQMLD